MEAWYLLAFSLFRLKKYATAEECCANVRNLIIKFKIADPDLEQGTLEIYEKCQRLKKTASNPEAEQDKSQKVEEEWETDSEEDIDADEGEGDDGDEEMKE